MARKIEEGTMVRVKPGVRLLSGRPSECGAVRKLYGDEAEVNGQGGVFLCSLDELLRMKDQRQRPTLREQLPYGKWVCEDGREVMFNRDYNPIWQRKDGVVSAANRDEWVKGIVNRSDDDTFYFGDWDAPWNGKAKRHRAAFTRCLTALAEWGIVIPEDQLARGWRQ